MFFSVNDIPLPERNRLALKQCGQRGTVYIITSCFMMSLLKFIRSAFNVPHQTFAVTSENPLSVVAQGFEVQKNGSEKSFAIRRSLVFYSNILILDMAEIYDLRHFSTEVKRSFYYATVNLKVINHSHFSIWSHQPLLLFHKIKAWKAHCF